MKWLFEEYSRKKQEIQNKLKDYKQIPEQEWFYELCFCLLTPGSKALIADACIKKLKELNFKNQDLNIHPHIKHMRFHNKRNQYLQELKTQYSEIHDKIKTEKDSIILRNWLAENVKGISLKESSHFLRNIGYRDLAIIDRHILKGLHKTNVIEKIPKSISKSRYLKIEQSFKEFSKGIGISIDELDLLFWSLQTGKVFK